MLWLKAAVIVLILAMGALRLAALALYAENPPAYTKKLLAAIALPYLLAGVLAADWLVDMTASLLKSPLPFGLDDLLALINVPLAAHNLETLRMAAIVAFALITLALNRFEKRYIPKRARR